MNLSELEAFCSVVANHLNMSAAANALERSQPTLSRQIQNLERELGTPIFVRTRNKVVGLTPTGEELLVIAQRIVRDSKDFVQRGTEQSAAPGGELKISTTHLHARYLLPTVVKTITERFPDVVVTLHQGDPIQCCELVATGDADIGITTAGERIPSGAVAIPAYALTRCVIAPRNHPLTHERSITLKALSKYPIVAYSTQFRGRWIVDEAFARAGLRPRVVCSAIDADVCKTYVEVGMGIAVLARIAIDPSRDRNLTVIDASHLFHPNILNLVLRKHGYLSRRARDFLTLFAPHISEDVIRKGLQGGEMDREALAQKAPIARSSYGFRGEKSRSR